MSINPKQLKKKAIFFAFEDVLVPGKMAKTVDKTKIEEILSVLQELEKKTGFNLCLVSGYRKEIAEKKLAESGLGHFFKKQNIFFVTDKYISGKAEIDKKIHLSKLKENDFFKDEFFKQKVVEDFAKKHLLLKKEMVLVGHDLWTDGFYTRRFSKMDFALVKAALSERDKPIRYKIKGLNYIKMELKDIRKLLVSPKEADYRFLDNYVENVLRHHLFSKTELSGLVSKLSKKVKSS